MGHLVQNIINFFSKQRKKNSVGSTQKSNYLKAYNSDRYFKEDFYLNLRKTIAWEEEIISKITDISTINYGRVLRTTNPVYKGKPFYRFYDFVDGLAATPEIPFDYQEVLTEAMNVRQNVCFKSHLDLKELGKILKFEIDVTTYDGAPCAESGFVDQSDIPPIDTWFYITTKYLYCWIPKMFIEKMQNAIYVEILESYNWLEDVAPELNKNIFEKLEQYRV